MNIPPAQVGAAIERYFILNNCRHRHLQELRRVLEPHVASLAAANAAPEDLAKLAESLRRLEESWAARDFQALAAADASFHLDLAGANLRGVDLRRATLRNADLRNAYCHTTDFRGVDLSQANIEGASFHRARISGAYFPPNVSAEELKMSVDLGTRIRLR